MDAPIRENFSGGTSRALREFTISVQQFTKFTVLQSIINFFVLTPFQDLNSQWMISIVL